ncbi:MAG TPA: hypothetical protein VMN36_07610 [Verrucomicrobiales bacterium]|nr:hypothetical protein [Verrucomicrobiales bacterium]
MPLLALLLVLALDLLPSRSGGQTRSLASPSGPAELRARRAGTVLSFPVAGGAPTLAPRAAAPQSAIPEREFAHILQEKRASETAGTQVLTTFFAAADIEAKLACILDPDAFEPSLRDYYQDPNRWEHRLDLQAFAYPQGSQDKEQDIFPFVIRPASKLTVGSLSEELEDSRLRPTIAYVKKLGSRYALDWPTYRQTRDHSWDRFLSSKTPVSEEFRVVVRLARPTTHEADAVISVFGVTLPHLPVFLRPADTPAYRTLLAGLESAAARFASLRLSFRPLGDTAGEAGAASPSIEVEEFISWGFLGLHTSSSGP